ncbi:MAG TPA: rRNA maturation RNase YbeY [Solirubrobacteraceae bacterium]|jgi:probable rRNA maturation factor|nr:rRNA maturation RNase YbeY [Solirubrobacteraceae bacterium]
MIDVEVLGAPALHGDATAEARDGEELPSLSEIRRLCALAAGSAGVHEGHVAIEFVDERRITELNAEHRSLSEPTDVLSFPIDGAEPAAGGRELGDVVICLAHTADVREAVVHGMLHLLGMDHETDEGQMLERQRELLARERR